MIADITRHAAARRRHDGTAGFTLVEVLVAFTILALLVISLQGGVSAAIGGLRRANDRTGAELVARTLLTGPVGSGAAAIENQQGRMNGFDWSVRYASLDMPLPVSRAPARWTPLRMIVEVRPASSGAPPLTVETIRLVRLGSP